MQTPEAKKKSSAAKDEAWTNFIQQFPNADVSKFVSQVYVDEKNNFSAEVFFKEGSGSLQSVFGSERKYWSERMRNVLSVAIGFPFQLSPRQSKTLRQSLLLILGIRLRSHFQCVQESL